MNRFKKWALVLILTLGYGAVHAKDFNDAKYPIKCMSTGRVGLNNTDANDVVFFDAGAVAEIKSASSQGLKFDLMGVQTIAFKTCRGNLTQKVREYEETHHIKFQCAHSLMCHQQVGTMPTAIPVERKEEVSYRGLPGPLVDDQCLQSTYEVGLMVCRDADGDFIINHKYSE